MASTYREPNGPQNNRDFGTYGESFPPYHKSIYLSCLSLFSILLTTLCMTLESYPPFNPGDISL